MVEWRPMNHADKGNSGVEGIGGLIRAWRKSRGLLQKQLAASAGMEVAQLWAVENDRNSPSFRTLSRIATALNISPAELLSPPSRDMGAPAIMRERNSTVHLDAYEAVPIMRPAGKEKRLAKRDRQHMEKSILNAAKVEAARQADIPTSLPFSFPIVLNEGGAEQLAHFLRAHLDVGSAIIRNVFTLFECHGIRVLFDDRLTERNPAVTFYSRRRRDYTIFLTTAFDGKPFHKEFLFLTEIGRAFVFASKKFETFTETDKSRRFAHHFAATFLMPASAVRMAVYSLRVKPGDWTFELLLRLKDRFGVSAESFNIRLWELGLISGAKHEAFARQIKEHYAQTGHEEPMPDNSAPKNRAGDLLAMDGSQKAEREAAGRSGPCR